MDPPLGAGKRLACLPGCALMHAPVTPPGPLPASTVPSCRCCPRSLPVGASRCGPSSMSDVRELGSSPKPTAAARATSRTAPIIASPHVSITAAHCGKPWGAGGRDVRAVCAAREQPPAAIHAFNQTTSEVGHCQSSHHQEAAHGAVQPTAYSCQPLLHRRMQGKPYHPCMAGARP
jgi:hypothetical protein